MPSSAPELPIGGVHVVNFQSHVDTDLPLGRFTVISGPSNSGKSAIVRAIRLALANARGTGYVRQGTPSATVTLTGAFGQARITRGKTNSYDLGDDAHVESYTKLGGAVPEQAAAVVHIDPDLCIAGQFDGPFLLTSSATEVARVLGDLTGANIAAAAAQEAAKRKASWGREAAQRAVEQEQTAERVMAFADLPEAQRAQAATEALLAEALEQSVVVGQTEALIAKAEDLHEAAEWARAGLAAITFPPAFYDLMAQAEQRANDYGAYTALRDHVVRLADRRTELKAQLAVDEVPELERQITQTLKEMGQCPTCGQTIR